ncbi:hypothetical protein V502_07954 [Pseudogymnoascus sp. VKM F-4520 (FW-2644)]|nr:hypothetical protein V502_07954 [Pseudogymnoascus sp. VKM F-4520 (FW-2644)]
MRTKTTTFLLAALGTAVSSTETCCTLLQKSLGSQLTFPNQSPYNNTITSYWALQESSPTPSCILLPSSPAAISQTLSLLSATQSCSLAIKGRGHNPAPGFANINGGVTIDMTPLSTIEISADHSIAKIGAGASWLDVYQFLNPLNVSVAGGRNGGVGVGGLLVGGGIAHFAPRVGWACDGVVNFEVVLGNGTLVNANRTSHPDLFRALKGGGNNFGVVTRFDLKTFPQGDIASALVINDISQRDAVLKAFTEITTAAEFDVYASLVTSLVFTSTTGKWEIINIVAYTQPVTQPAVFKDLLAVPSATNSTSLTITTLAELADEAETPPTNQIMATATFKPSLALMLEFYDLANEFFTSFNPVGGITWLLTFEPLVAAMVPKSRGNQDDVLGLGPGDNGFILLLSASWADTASTKAVEEATRHVMALLEACAEAKGLLLKFQYLNYAAPFQTPLEAYGEENLRFLRGVSGKYDPKGVFQKRVPGGFKLW